MDIWGLISDSIFRAVQVPDYLLQIKNFNEIYTSGFGPVLVGTVDRQTYRKTIKDFGEPFDEFRKSTGETLMKTIIKSVFMPKQLKQTKLLHQEKEFGIQMTVNTLYIYYNEVVQFLYVGAEYTLTYTNVLPVIFEVEELENRNINVDLFDELHNYEVQRNNYQTYDALYGENYKYNEKRYTWTDEDNNLITNGVLKNVTFARHHKKKYHMLNDIKPVKEIILFVKPFVNKVIHTPEYINWARKISERDHNRVFLKTQERVLFVTPIETRSIVNLEIDRDYLKADSEFWTVLSEIPTYELFKKKAEVFKDYILNIQPESMRYIDIDPELNSKFLNGENDNLQLSKCLIKLQRDWDQLWQLANERYFNKKDLFRSIKGLTSYISKIFENIPDIGLFLSRKYFSFDKRKTLKDIRYDIKTGTYIKVSKLLKERKPFYTINTIKITYMDEYNRYKNSEFTESDVPNEDVQIIYFFEQNPIEIIIVPDFFDVDTIYEIDKPSLSGHVFLLYDFKLVKMLNAAEKLIIKFKRKEKKEVSINDLIYTTNSNFIDIYSFQEMSTIAGDKEMIYKHFDNIKIYRIYLKDTFEVNKISNEAININDQIKQKFINPPSEFKLNESTKQKNWYDKKGIKSLTINNQNIKIDLDLKSFDVRSKRFLEKWDMSISAIKWENKYGIVYGTPSLWNRDIDYYRIIDFNQNTNLTEDFLNKKSFIIGSISNESYGDSIKLHDKIQSKWNSIIKSINDHKEDESLSIFSELKSLFKMEYDFNKLQPWFDEYIIQETKLLKILPIDMIKFIKFKQ